MKAIVAAALAVLALLTLSMRITADEPGTATATTVKAEALEDAKYSWARDDIGALAELGAVLGYPDGTFKPNQPITRAELAAILSRALDLEAGGGEDVPYTDIKDHWAEGYIASLSSEQLLSFVDGESFEPDRQVVRSEIVQIMMQVIPVDEKFGSLLKDIDSSFVDVTPDDELFKKVEAAERLGIIPIHFGVAFEPNRPVTRAEAASMVRRLISLNVLEGVITSADPEGTITVAAEESSQTKLNVSSSTLTVRNGLAARPNKLQEGDVVYVVASGSDAKFVHSIGELTQEDLVARAASAVKGLLTEEEIAAIVRGDFDTVEQQLGPKVKERLIDQGLSEEEADALLSRNWDRIPELLQERAVSSVSEQLGVPPELIVDTVQQKWDSVRSFAEQKLTEYVIAALADTGALDTGSGAGA
jgi:hypothetical protein